MIVKHLKGTSYFEATYKDKKYLGYSFFEAISRTLDAIEKYENTKTTN